MKSKFFILLAGAIGANLVAFILLWNAFVDPMLFKGSEDPGSIIWAFVFVHLVIMVLIGIYGYHYIIKPYSVRIIQLEQAAEENKKAEQIRKEFVANVSHELKTPLTSILGFIETLQDGAAEDPEIRTKFIDIIAIETARLKRLIQDILVLSDIENKRDSDQQTFDVKSAVQSTADTLKPIAEKKDITMLMEIDASIAIRGSVDRFRQMMMNLMENAIKYSDEGGRIWIKGSRQQGKIVVSVRDEGIGIAQEHHDRLFERFYRVDKSRSKKVGGTGLGLSIVKHIAVLFGATLKVESNIGEGTEFFVIFDMEEDMDNS